MQMTCAILAGGENTRMGQDKVAGILPLVSVKELEEHPCFFKNNNSVFANINTVGDLVRVEAA